VKTISSKVVRHSLA